MRVAIIGAGAAGLFAAGFLAKAGQDVVVFDKNEKVIACAGKFKYNLSNIVVCSILSNGSCITSDGSECTVNENECTVNKKACTINGDKTCTNDGYIYTITKSGEENLCSISTNKECKVDKWNDKSILGNNIKKVFKEYFKFFW